MKNHIELRKLCDCIIIATLFFFLGLITLVPGEVQAAKHVQSSEILPKPPVPNLEQYVKIFEALNDRAPYVLSRHSQLDKFALYPKTNKIIVRMSLHHNQKEYRALLVERGVDYYKSVFKYTREVQKEICHYGVTGKLIKEGIKIFAQVKFRDGPNLLYTQITSGACNQLKEKK